MRIGFLDSGIGGLTTMSVCAKSLGGGDFVYLADEKNAPYGIKDKTDLIQIGQNGVKFLSRLGCKVIVLACNTLTAIAKPKLCLTYPNITFIGVEPAVIPASKENLKVALLATPRTIGSERVKALLQSCRGKVTAYPISSLATIIENYSEDSEFLTRYAERNLKYLFDYDAVVLGCTHFIYLRPIIEKVFPNIKIYDGNLGVATRLKSIVGEQNIPLRCNFFTTNGANSEKCRKIFSNFTKKIQKGY